MPYVWAVRTASGATAVQIVYSSHRGLRDIEHIGSAHDNTHQIDPICVPQLKNSEDLPAAPNGGIALRGDSDADHAR